MLFLKEFYSNISQGDSQDYQGSGNLSSINKIPEILSHHIDFLSDLYANQVKNIASNSDFVNAKKSNIEPSPIPYQAAAKLPKIPDNTLNQEDLSVLLSDDIMLTTLSDTRLPVNQSEAWIKVSQIQAGMEIATIEGWEKIVEIKEHIREQVYDIEVNGTHNFVGNNIIAHNTYITGGGLTVQNSSGQNVFSLDTLGNMKLAGTITSEAGAFDTAEEYPTLDNSIEAAEVVVAHQKTALADGFIASVDDKPSNVSPTELNRVYQKIDELSNTENTSVDRTGFEPASSVGETGGLPLAYRPKYTEASPTIPYIEKSSKPYQDSIIGIISTKPGISLRSSAISSQTKPVALNGRVPVKVSTENGEIKVGDYLTSSSIPGVAMSACAKASADKKGTCKPGQVVGKALEDYSGTDIGKILVFVNVTFADPGNFLASLSLDSSGNLIAPKIKVDKLLINDPSLTLGTSSFLAYDFAPTDNSSDSNNGTGIGNNSSVDVLASLKNLDQSLVDLKSKQSTDSANIAGIQSDIASLSARLQTIDDRKIEDRLSKMENGILNASPSSTLNPQDSTINPPSSTVKDLNLTPPDILYATRSATLANLSVTSEATVSGMLLAYDLNISNSLKSLGTTTLGKTTIAGDLNIDGTLSIENGSEVNVIPTLYLQKSPLANLINIFDGKVSIDKSGNISTQGTLAATEVKTNKLTISNSPIASSSATLAASIGTGSIPAGQTKVTISASITSDKSRVFITPTTSTDKVLSVTNIKPGESFDVSITSTSSDEIKFNWWVVQTE